MCGIGRRAEVSAKQTEANAMTAAIVSFPRGQARAPAAASIPPETNRPFEGRDIAVIGAGLSGVLVALHLLWRCGRDDRIYLVERARRFGQGLAYATGNPRHLLNIRIENMSAFADEPAHFVRWLRTLPEAERRAAGERTWSGIFVRRQLYGAYIQHLLEDAMTRLGCARNLYLVTDEAVAVRPDGERLTLATACGRSYPVHAVVLALGNFPPDRLHSPDYFGDPWHPHAVRNLAPGRTVLLLGTGLTMVDVCLSLMDEGFEGPICAMSRRGLLPEHHGASRAWAGLRLDAEDRRSLAALCRAVRREVRRAELEGVGWRSVIDALRPHTQLLWQELSPADKRRFLRHLRPWWESHRHRVAPPVRAAIEAARGRGRLNVLRGRIERIEVGGDGLEVTWRRRGASEGEQLEVQRIINCTGPGTDYEKLNDPLVVQLLASGLARPDPYRLGLHATSRGTLIGADGRVSPRLFGVGPVVRGALWESTSVPDIRSQAEEVAIAALGAASRSRSAMTRR
jgi:uncharacterized NAD(P)/FAD-binding protein YdhS